MEWKHKGERMQMQLNFKDPRVIKFWKKMYGKNLAREIAIGRALCKMIGKKYPKQEI